MAVLAAMGEGKPRRVRKTIRRAMHHLGNHGQRPNRPRTDARGQQQLGEISRTTIGRCGEGPVQPPRMDVARRGHRDVPA